MKCLKTSLILIFLLFSYSNTTVVDIVKKIAFPISGTKAKSLVEGLNAFFKKCSDSKIYAFSPKPINQIKTIYLFDISSKPSCAKQVSNTSLKVSDSVMKKLLVSYFFYQIFKQPHLKVKKNIAFLPENKLSKLNNFSLLTESELNKNQLLFKKDSRIVNCQEKGYLNYLLNLSKSIINNNTKNLKLKNYFQYHAIPLDFYNKITDKRLCSENEEGKNFFIPGIAIQINEKTLYTELETCYIEISIERNKINHSNLIICNTARDEIEKILPKEQYESLIGFTPIEGQLFDKKEFYNKNLSEKYK